MNRKIHIKIKLKLLSKKGAITKVCFVISKVWRPK